MSSKHNLIICSPNTTERLIKLFTKNIELYDVKLSDNEENFVDKIILHKIYQHSENEAIKCIAWQPLINFDNISNFRDIIAVALWNGVIRIISLGNSIFESEEYCLTDRELRAKNIKQSLFLEWNPWQKNFLAQAIDKSKGGAWGNDPSLVVWEIQREFSNRVSGTSSQHSFYQQLSNVTAISNMTVQNRATVDNVIDQPAFEFCRGEVINSFAWISRKRFICGINNKFLKIFEIPEIQPLKMVVTEAVYGLCINILQPLHFASFVEEKVFIWKEDAFENPVLTYMEGNVVELLEWSPLRDGYLCVTFKDRPFVKVLDTKIAILNNTQDFEHSIVDRILKSSDESNIIWATWHRKIQNCVFMYLGDERFELVTVRNRRLAYWSVQQTIVTSANTTLNLHYFKKDSSLSDLSCNNIEQSSNDNKNHFNETVDSIRTSTDYLKPECYNLLDNDIASIMKERSVLGYGLKCQSKEIPFSSLFKDHPELKMFWKWIEDATINPYSADNFSRSKINPFCGVIDCIRDIVKPSYSKIDTECLFHLNVPVSVPVDVRWSNIYDLLPFQKYTHEYRDKIFSVCGLPFNKKIENWRFLLENIDNNERAAAISLVTLNFDLALQYLKRITDDKGIDNEMLRLCLAGFNTQSGQSSNSNWSSICRDVLQRLGDSRPYLRLIFNFLIVSNKQDLQFIKSSKILLLDKIAIATLYMDDENLIEFLNHISSTHLKYGNLEAVVMTGLRSPEFIDLLQAYINRTYDVQTAAISVLQANILTKNALGKTKVSLQWVESYRHFLDNCSMWFIRADFDNANQYMNFCASVEMPDRFQKVKSVSAEVAKSSSSMLKSSFNLNEVYVACNYCYGKISQTSKNVNSSHTTGTVARTNRNDGTGLGNTAISSFAMHSGGCKATICQNCRKPLPRCSVCLMNMGTMGDNSRSQNMNVAVFTNKDDQMFPNPIWGWFIWCQKCKHGGHAGHLHSWFRDWDECPVSGCKCACSCLDSSFLLCADSGQRADQSHPE